jgi:hypothetical protein
LLILFSLQGLLVALQSGLVKLHERRIGVTGDDLQVVLDEGLQGDARPQAVERRVRRQRRAEAAAADPRRRSSTPPSSPACSSGTG